MTSPAAALDPCSAGPAGVFFTAVVLGKGVPPIKEKTTTKKEKINDPL
ncbi:MAG: hypothetical protein WCA49_03725 [Candidatus Sulfotelmatobacter sp.]